VLIWGILAILEALMVYLYMTEKGIIEVLIRLHIFMLEPIYILNVLDIQMFL